MPDNALSTKSVGDKTREQPTKKVIAPTTRELIERLLLERISLARIARALQVSQTWLQLYANEKYASVPRQVEVTPKKKGVVLQK